MTDREEVTNSMIVEKRETKRIRLGIMHDAFSRGKHRQPGFGKSRSQATEAGLKITNTRQIHARTWLHNVVNIEQIQYDICIIPLGHLIWALRFARASARGINA